METTRSRTPPPFFTNNGEGLYPGPGEENISFSSSDGSDEETQALPQQPPQLGTPPFLPVLERDIRLAPGQLRPMSDVVSEVPQTPVMGIIEEQRVTPRAALTRSGSNVYAAVVANQELEAQCAELEQVLEKTNARLKDLQNAYEELEAKSYDLQGQLEDIPDDSLQVEEIKNELEDVSESLAGISDQMHEATQAKEQLNILHNYLKVTIGQPVVRGEGIEDHQEAISALQSMASVRGLNLFRRNVVPAAMLTTGAAAALYLTSNPEAIIELMGWGNFETALELLKNGGAKLLAENLENVLNFSAVAGSAYIGGHALAVAFTGVAALSKLVLTIASVMVYDTSKALRDEVMMHINEIVVPPAYYLLLTTQFLLTDLPGKIVEGIKDLTLLLARGFVRSLQDIAYGIQHNKGKLALLLVVAMVGAYAAIEHPEATEEFFKPAVDAISNLETSGMEYLSWA